MLTNAGKKIVSSINAPAAWQEFSSAEGNFAVLMPGMPSYENKSTSTAVGTIDMHMFTLNVKLDAAYIIMYSDYPEIVTKAPPDRSSTEEGTVPSQTPRVSSSVSRT